MEIIEEQIRCHVWLPGRCDRHDGLDVDVIVVILLGAELLTLRLSIKPRATRLRGAKGQSANEEPQWQTRSGNQAELLGRTSAEGTRLRSRVPPQVLPAVSALSPTCTPGNPSGLGSVTGFGQGPQREASPKRG
jgi:hypothetical protein